MRIYREGCDYWKSMPVSCRTMSAGRCDIALALIDKHAAEVKEADAKLQGYVQLLLKGRAENSREARIAGATYAKEKVKALAGFQGSPPVLTAWLIRSGTLVVGAPKKDHKREPDTMLTAATSPLSMPFEKPTFLASSGADTVTAQLSDLLPAVEEQVSRAVLEDKAQLTQHAMVATQLNDHSEGLLETANWVPAAWAAAGWNPNTVTGWCSPWLLSQRAGTTRMSSTDMPTNGMPTLYRVVEGQGWVFCWHADDAELQGSHIAKQYQHLLKLAHPIDAVKWMSSRVKVATVKTGDQVWVPFGWFAAVMSASGVPLLLMGMPWINSKVCAQNSEAAVLVLQNQLRILANCAESEDAAWGPAEGSSEFSNWCSRELKRYVPAADDLVLQHALKDKDENSATGDSQDRDAEVALARVIRRAESAASTAPQALVPSATLDVLMNLAEDGSAAAVVAGVEADNGTQQTTVPGPYEAPPGTPTEMKTGITQADPA